MRRAAALITHTHPPSASEAVRGRAEPRERLGWRLVATADEHGKHGDGRRRA